MLFPLTEEELLNWYQIKKKKIMDDFDKEVQKHNNFEIAEKHLKKRLVKLNKRYSILLKREHHLHFFHVIYYKIENFFDKISGIYE